MSKIKWYFNRLKTMQLNEIIWRFLQALLQLKERLLFNKKKEIINFVFYKKLKKLKINIEKLSLNIENKDYLISDNIDLLGNYNYEKYKMNWHAGFQTENSWPLYFSYSIQYKDKDTIGDARTNWELNRHYQFVILAKNYFITKNKKYLNEFKKLFYDWNKNNPFLYGISWTSVMEIALRTNNWIYSYYFLNNSSCEQKLLKDLETGIINMTEYIYKHYSRFSSANNHLII